ncbi:MAG: TonB-dependent receptor [Flavisolibacter sp.]|nr:TonB-dependent receptor [Flavisolibacter sp.]
MAQKDTTANDTASVVKSLEEVVISASRISEKQLAAPVSISKLTTGQIEQAASPSFFDAISNMKGVHMITPSLGFKIINTRGFSNTTNVRFVQLIDNVDNQSPHIGAPIASALSPSDLDIDHVEIIQGVASALYGMNATNGLANFTTKDPFTHPGLSIQQQVAIHHLNDPNNVSPRLYNETNIRWAHVIAKKWALKLNTGFNKGYDWAADNSNDLNATANQSVNLLGKDNPAYDAVNGYGNESSNRRTIALNGKNYVVARTGYAEREVADYHLQNWKGDAALYYRPNDNTTFTYTYRVAFLNNIYQRSNRFRLENYLLQQQILQYKGQFVQARAYVNSENTGDSYNLRSMAENIDVGFKNTTQWYADYTTAYNNAFVQINNVATAHHLARASADNGRLQPGTEGFNEQLKRLQQINNWDVGAALKVKAHLVHTEATIDIGKLLKTKYNLQAGADFRDYIIVPDGNYFINPTDSGHNLNYTSYGFFVQTSNAFFNKKLQLSAALRASSYEYFSLKFNPRLTAVYTVSKSNFVRFSYQNGHRFASIFEGFSNINSGGVKRVGGLKVMSDGVFENSWLKGSIDTFQAAVNRDVNTGGLSQAAAIEKNKDLLQRNTYSYLKPEQMNSFELGYRSILLDNKLFIDGDVYYNLYSNFIAQIEASIPNTTDVTQIPAYLYDRNKQARYRLWTNSKTVVRNYGAELDLRYLLNKQYTVSANASYQTLKKTAQNDGLEDGFNTPQWMANAGITGANIYKNLGFTLSVKYQSSYYWQSFLVNGTVPSVFIVNVALSYLFTKPTIGVKLGATNIFNRYYYSILGGPQIGGLYFTTIAYSIK